MLAPLRPLHSGEHTRSGQPARHPLSRWTGLTAQAEKPARKDTGWPYGMDALKRLPADPLRTQPGARYPLYPASPRLPPPSRPRSVARRRTIITILLRFIPALLQLLPTTSLIAAILLMVALGHSCAAKGDAHRKQTGKERASQYVLEFHRVLQR
jgi:hypothetical protein